MVCKISFSWAPKSMWMVTAAMKLKDTMFLGRKAMTNLDSVLKSRDVTANRGLYSQSYGFSSSYPVVITSGCESWTIQKAEL